MCSCWEGQSAVILLVGGNDLFSTGICDGTSRLAHKWMSTQTDSLHSPLKNKCILSSSLIMYHEFSKTLGTH